MLLYLFDKVTVVGDDKDKRIRCGESVKSLFVENQ